MKVKPLLGLAGVLLSVMISDINDSVTATALPDIRGALGIGYDTGTWIESLYLSAQPLGMAISAWFIPTLTVRRWTLTVIAFVGVTSTLLPFSPNAEVFLALRLLQGLAGGLMVPLLLSVALAVLPPPVRLYGLAAYALTATFVPYLAAAVAAFWQDTLHWQYVFYQALPGCILGAMLAAYGFPADEPDLSRFEQFDWRAVILIAVGCGSVTTMLYQGDRFDWFNSPIICALAATGAIAIPLLLVNEWFHPLPFLKLQLLGRRNFCFGIVALVVFIIATEAAGPVTVDFLTRIKGFRPAQAQFVTLIIAGSQLVLLPLMALLLDRESVDSRVVSVVGVAFIVGGCVGSSNLDPDWTDAQFYAWQLLQSVGQAMVVMSLLMMATNTIKKKEEGPFASANFNFTRSMSEVLGIWLVQLIERWRGNLHYNRIVDQVGLNRWRSVQGPGVLPAFPPPLRADGTERAPGSLAAFAGDVMRQASLLTYEDKYLIIAAIAASLALVIALLPIRTRPPRIELG